MFHTVFPSPTPVRFARLLPVLLWLSLGGCRDTANEPVADTDYYPLQPGDYWVYQVTQERYTGANTSTKQSWQVQETVSSSYSQNGQLVYQIDESVRPTAQSTWKLTAIYTVYKTPAEVVSQERNVPTVRLTFPVAVSTRWNVNAYNASPDTLLRYQNVNGSFTSNGRLFANTISVVGPNDSTLIDQTKYQRVYARHVGLVYREDTAISFCQSSPDCVGKGRIESGVRQRWELIAGNRLP